MKREHEFTSSHYRSLERGQDNDAVNSIKQFADPVIAAANTHRSLSEATEESLKAGSKIEDVDKLRRDLTEITTGFEMAFRRRLSGDEKFSTKEKGLMADLEVANIRLNSDPDSTRRSGLLKAFEAGRQGISTGGSATVTNLMQRHNDLLSNGSKNDRVQVTVDHGMRV